MAVVVGAAAVALAAAVVLAAAVAPVVLDPPEPLHAASTSAPMLSPTPARHVRRLVATPGKLVLVQYCL